MMRLISPLPALWLALLLVLGQWCVVAHATEHQAASVDHAADCFLCLHLHKTPDTALPVSAVTLASIVAIAGLAPDVIWFALPTTIPSPAIRGPPERG